jgi:thiol-disulfide isomerase/thioredoxin
MPTKRPPLLWIGLAAIVGVALVVAVVASRGGPSAERSAAGLQETRPVTVSGSALPPLPGSGTDPAAGLVAPTLTGSSFDGTPVAIAPDGKGKLVLFVAHWCPHCQREVPLLVDYLKTHGLPAGVELWTVATSTTDTRPNYPPSSWLQDVGWKAPVLADTADGTAATAYGLPGFPYLVALDKDGKVLARLSGEFPTATFASLAKAAAA